MSREETIFGDRWPYSKAKSVLLRSASQVMREGGPRAATLKNIAGKAGVTEPAIFRHFDGVDGVFQSLFNVVELFFNEFQSYYRTEGLVGLDRLESAYLKIFSTIKENEDFCYLLVQPGPIFSQYEKFRDRLIDLKARDKQSVIECMKEAKAKGQLLPGVDTGAAAMALTGASLLVLQTWTDNPDSLDPIKEGKKIWSGIRMLIQNPDAPKAVKSIKAANRK